MAFIHFLSKHAVGMSTNEDWLTIHLYVTRKTPTTQASHGDACYTGLPLLWGPLRSSVCRR